MVAIPLTVRRLGQTPVKCNARAMLHRAHADLERGALIEAGCRLREAVRLYLLAECEWYGCLPSKKAQQSAGLLAKALKACTAASDVVGPWLEEVIEHGNALAHCHYVRPGLIATCLSIMHRYLDDAPHLEQPTAAGRLV